jgi:hypothetical protein
MFGNRIAPFLTCAITTLSLLAGCGGGGGGSFSGSPSAPAVGRYVPNYAAETDPATNQPNRLLHWGSFPVKIHFVANSYLTAERKNLATAGFNWWSPSLDGTLRYQLVDDPAAADITIRFEPKGLATYTGITQYSYAGDGRLVSADITLNLSYLSNAAHIPATAAHEFGHALGIGGHSALRADLMATSPNVVSLLSPTLRDANTMKTAYIDMLAGLGRSAPNEGTIHTAAIACGGQP